MSYTVNTSILFTDLPILERPAAAKAAGFDSIEFWWPFETAVPSDAEVDAFVAAIDNAGVQLAGLNFFAGDMPAGDRGLVSWKGRCGEFKDNIDVVVGIGERLGTRSFNALYGNRQAEYKPEEQDELAIKNLRAAADGVARIGGTVLLEPVSGTPEYPLKTAQDVMDVISRVERDNVKLLADFYHLATNGDDVPAVIEAYAAQFGHIQIADSPGRGEPGTGTLPLAEWIGRSRELGYLGGVALEYKATQPDPFAWAFAAA